MNEILEILGVFALSAVKFGVAGVPAAVFAKFSLFKAVTVTFAGGLTGTFIFTYLSDWIINSWKKITEKFSRPDQIKRKFTKTNRFIIKVKHKFGLLGIAIITPLFLSFPLGVFLAVRYYHHYKQRIIVYMGVSTLAWSVILYFFYNYFYYKISSFL